MRTPGVLQEASRLATRPPSVHFPHHSPPDCFLCMSYHITALLQTLQQCPITKNKIPRDHNNRASPDPGSGCLPALILPLFPHSLHLVGPRGLGPVTLLTPVPTRLPHFPGASAHMVPPQDTSRGPLPTYPVSKRPAPLLSHLLSSCSTVGPF